MTSEHKSYGYEGGYEDWTSEKVFSNMRLSREDASESEDAPSEPENVKTETSEDEVEVVEETGEIVEEE